ncbi:exopolygalacturonase-like [Punica granatum]|uniref:Uncharacterized protein n=2 Tax=Punica granatum TaxID=22663 RepID=A0A218WG44_PUNGR|nr:exopolygalacturonase-like [Punica granatum]OWM71201.1 hypothetical protein CDL15_Pgr011328 [Punica granatum]PKI65048.1 hypothetical protein CRG98_014517 [Punica granatum]
MAKIIGGRKFNIIRVVFALVLVALASLCEAKGLWKPRLPVPVPVPGVGLVRARVAKARDPLAIQASEAIRGLDLTEKVFNVLTYGADASGLDDSTEAFMKTWVDMCHWNGKSRMLVPRGTFQVGELVFQGKCAGPAAKVVDIKGTLKALTDPSSFTSDYCILFQLIDGLIIIGSGVIDGQGASVWQYSDCNSNSNCQRMPINVKFDTVSHAIVSRLNSVDSKGFHIGVTNSNNIRLYNLRITAPDESPNTDGIHISKSNNVKISNAVIGTGDDCISMIQGCTDITIKKVFCGPGHGISIGSLGKYKNEADVRGITVKNCTLTGTENGVRIKTWPDSPPSAASKLIFANLVMNNVKNPIIIDQEYNSHNKKQIVPSRVKISDVHFVNIRGTSTSPLAVNIVCSKQFPCQQIQLKNINLQYTGLPSKGPVTSTCLNAQGLLFGGIQIPPACK